MKVFTEENYKNIQPNFAPFSIDEMPQDVKKTFLLLTSAYRYMLTQYLIEKIDLKKYDDLIKQNEYKFLPIDEESMDVYQWFNSEELSYLYLRNNVYLMNLSKNERKEFLSMLKKDGIVYTKEMEKFINSTYKKAIFEDIKRNPCMISFGPLTGAFMALNNSMVIGIRYDEFNRNGFLDGEWSKNYMSQLKYISIISNKIEKEVEDKLQIVCNVFKYNEYSVKKKSVTK